MEWSWTAWAVSAAAVVLSGLIATAEGNWRRRSQLAMGFADHGGMWSDLLLLSIANAVIVPQLTAGAWLVGAAALGMAASLWVHRHWYRRAMPRGTPPDIDADDARRHLASAALENARGDHMWPARRHGTWSRDLSWAGWAHVVYVAAELALLVGFAVHPAPPDVVLLVAAIVTIHVPIGLLQPRWFVSGHLATVREQPLLLPCLALLWTAIALKL